MFKTLYLPLILVAVFVVSIGFLVKNPSKFLIPTVKTTSEEKQLETKKLGINDVFVYAKVASTDEARAKGLGGVKKLNWYDGMLFVFPEKDVQATFWMKDMIMPIDIIWINDDKIVKIDKNVQPEPNKTDEQLKRYTSKTPIDYVLEVSAGFCDGNNIKVGQTLSGL